MHHPRYLLSPPPSGSRHLGSRSCVCGLQRLGRFQRSLHHFLGMGRGDTSKKRHAHGTTESDRSGLTSGLTSGLVLVRNHYQTRRKTTQGFLSSRARRISPQLRGATIPFESNPCQSACEWLVIPPLAAPGVACRVTGCGRHARTGSSIPPVSRGVPQTLSPKIEPRPKNTSMDELYGDRVSGGNTWPRPRIYLQP